MELLYLLPKNLLSRLVGWLVNLPLPPGLSTFAVDQFAKVYDIRVDEAEKPLSEYKSIGDFFVRRLRPDLRPLGAGLLVHPADSVITEAARIEDGQLLQAKGRFYSLQDFVGTRESAEAFRQGAFATYYLCPTDYHRFHSPVEGKIRRIRHLPGHLWPVNDWSVSRISQLFCVNERVLVEMETASGPVSLVAVGATNVGQISMNAWPELRTNDPAFPSMREKVFDPPVNIGKGEELGAFHMGSTVVVLVSEEFMDRVSATKSQWPLLKGNHVRVRADLLQDSKSASVPH